MDVEAVPSTSSGITTSYGNNSGRNLTNIETSTITEGIISEGAPSDEDYDYATPSESDFNPNDEMRTESEQLVLVEKGYIDADPLPPGWSTIQHESGLKLYMHEVGRVCTTSRPYFLGAGSVRKHDIPRSAIPCLSYLYKTNNGDAMEENIATEENDTTLQEMEGVSIEADIVCEGLQVAIPMQEDVAYTENFATEVSFPAEVNIDSDNVQISHKDLSKNYAVPLSKFVASAYNVAILEKKCTEQESNYIVIDPDEDKVVPLDNPKPLDDVVLNSQDLAKNTVATADIGLHENNLILKQDDDLDMVIVIADDNNIREGIQDNDLTESHSIPIKNDDDVVFIQDIHNIENFDSQADVATQENIGAEYKSVVLVIEQMDSDERLPEKITEEKCAGDENTITQYNSIDPDKTIDIIDIGENDFKESHSIPIEDDDNNDDDVVFIQENITMKDNVDTQSDVATQVNVGAEDQSVVIVIEDVPKKFSKDISKDVTKHVPKDPAKTIDIDELGAYCRKLFHFKKLRVMRFNSWSERRQFSKRRKHVHQLHKTAPLEPKVIIKCPVQSKGGESSKKWLMNTAGKSHVCILHEYVQHSLKKQPKYTFSELENAATPYAATVTINDMKYGVGYGTSKKQAKSNAAKATLQILIPEMDKKPSEEGTSATNNEETDASNITFFDTIRILDPRVTDFCAKTTEPLPCDLLKSCINRNQNLSEMKITYEGNGEDEEMLKFTMTVGPNQATVSCKNKREAKQQAAQAILQQLHPHVHSWGALLRLYGSSGCMSFKEKLTQKPTEQSAMLHVPQDQMPSPIPSTNEAIMKGLRDKFNSFKTRGLCQKYQKRVPSQVLNTTK